MAIAHLNQADVLRRSRQALGLPFQADRIDEIFLAACLRRAAAIFAPCSRATLIAAVLDSLEYLKARTKATCAKKWRIPWRVSSSLAICSNSIKSP